MCKKVRNTEKLYLKIIDTSDENIKYHAMKNIIYRRKIRKMYIAMQEIKKQERAGGEQGEKTRENEGADRASDKSRESLLSGKP